MVRQGNEAAKKISGRVILALLMVYLFWGGTYLGMKYAVETMPPFLMAGLRFTVTGWILFGIQRLRGVPNPTRVEWRNAGIVGVLLLACGNGLVALAETQVPSAITSLLLATVPLWITTITFFTEGRKPGVSELVGIGLGLCGIAVLAWRGESGATQGVAFFGIALILIAALSWSAGSVYSRRAQLPGAPLMSTAAQMIVGGVALMLMAAVHGDFTGFSFAQVSGRSWLAVAYLVLCGSMLGYTSYIWLLKNAEPSVASTYAYVNPVVALFLGWAVAGEQIGPQALVAALIIITAVVLLTVFRGRPAKAKQAVEETAA